MALSDTWLKANSGKSLAKLEERADRDWVLKSSQKVRLHSKFATD